MSSPLLTIPIELRERVYTNLLNRSMPVVSGDEKAPSSPLCKLLFLNQQIHNEIKTFLRSKLCVLIRTNDPDFVKDILKGENCLPIVSQLRSKDGTVQQSVLNAPIALELDLYMYHSYLAAESFSAFIIPASSIKALLNILWRPDWMIWTMQASASFNLVDTFAYSLENATNLLIQPWIDWFLPAHFVGVSTSPQIPQVLVMRLKEQLLGDYAAGGHMQKLQSLQHGATEQVDAENWDAAAERYMIAAKYSKIIWNCHLQCLTEEEPQRNLLLHLWIMTNDNAASYVQLIVNGVAAAEKAVSESDVFAASEHKQKLEKARQFAEQEIAFLSSRSPFPNETVKNDERIQKFIRKHKAKTNFRLHLACKGTGDFGAAVEYLEEALKYEPESENMLRGKIDALKLEEPDSSREVRHPVVRWGSVGFD